MNLFNEFIKELKEEDLIEGSKYKSEDFETESDNLENPETVYEDELIADEEIFADEDISESFSEYEPENESFVREEVVEESVQDEDDSEAVVQIAAETAKNSEISAKNSASEEMIFVENSGVDFAIVDEILKSPANESGYFRKRAMDEVSFLQMVENIFSGVERQQMKIVPKPYNELPVKQALHSFLQISDDAVDSPEHAQSEFALLQETESWYSALSHRDKHISVANLRLFCETTRPPLSSPALVSLARFYRNLPYSEAARNKFDLIATRLFSKDIDDNKREMLFHRDELIEHFKGLYREWESISIYTSDEDDSDILLTAIKFEEFTAEAVEAESFDQLIETDFFNRLRVFKKSINENFFAPLISATAVESNVKIGNRYVELLEAERDKENASVVEEKYGFLHDQTISDATSKTLHLVELLKKKKVKKPEKIENKAQAKESKSIGKVKQTEKVQPETKNKKTQTKITGGLFAVNKWLLLTTIIVAVLSFGLYLWAATADVADKQNADVKVVDIKNSSLSAYLQTARISKETFYAVTVPSWDGISSSEKEEFLRKIISVGSEKGFKSVHLLNAQGKSVGFASPEKVEVYKP